LHVFLKYKFSAPVQIIIDLLISRLWIIAFAVLCTFNLQAQVEADSLSHIKDSTELFYENDSSHHSDSSQSNDTTFIQTDSVQADTGILVSKDAVEEIVDYTSADSSILNIKEKKFYLFGNANVKYGSFDLTADFIEIDFEKKELLAKGRIDDSTGRYVDVPKFKDGDQEVQADTMRYNFNSKRGRMQGLRIQEGESYIICNKVFRDSTGDIYTDIGKYTTCNHEHPHFYMKARRLKIIPDKKIIAGPSNLVVADVPTPAYIPFLYFPNQKNKTSGIVIPQYGLSTDRGYNLINGGYYLRINDYLDQTITGDFYFRGSWGVKSNTRYAKMYKYNGDMSLGYAFNKFGDPDDPNYRVSPDYQILWKHNQDPKSRPGTVFSSDVNIVSNQYNLNNSFNPQSIVSNTFRSSVSYSKMMGQGKYNLRMGATHNQNTSTKEFNMELPFVNFDVNRFNPFAHKERVGRPKWYENIGMSYSSNFTNRVNTYDSLIFERAVFQDFRNMISHSIPVSTSIKLFKGFFTLNPSINYSEQWYFKSIEKVYDAANDTVLVQEVDGFSRASDYGANLSLSTRIYGIFNFKRNPKIEAIRHVITPTLTAGYKPDFSQDRFGYYKEVQIDEMGNTERYSIYEQAINPGPGPGRNGLLSFTVNNNLEMKRYDITDSSKDVKYVKILESFDIGGNYNFLKDSLKLSEIRFAARTTLFQMVSVQLNGSLDPYSRGEGGVQMNRYAIETDGVIGRWTNASFISSINLNPEAFGKTSPATMQRNIGEYTDPEWRNIIYYPGHYIDFNIPWNLSLNYSINYSRQRMVTNISNLVTFSGDLSVTENWKVVFNSGFDIKSKEMTFTSFDFVRDLHCWQITFNWMPIGARKSFMFGLAAKSTLLQDMKLNKNGFWFDN
jgi:lipopolysaccharide assembly outer membrane protein LptD (OstA)